MEFRTTVKPLDGYEGLVTHDRPVVMLGSCFSDNIGNRLAERGFDCTVNPSGTLYNPASMASCLLDLLYDRPFTEADDLFQDSAGIWHSWSHHSRFSGRDPQAMLAAMNSEASRAREALSKASALIVTFGTSWLFRHRESRRVVANCHKMPAGIFSREMLTPAQTAGLWKKMLRELASRFPGLKVVFTVSPIRHKADGPWGNTVSKSALHLAVSKLIEELPEQAVYFPAYEIMDYDLRDYRFYAADMMHPSEVAADYIYSIFAESFMTPETRSRADEHLRAARRAAHRPLITD